MDSLHRCVLQVLHEQCNEGLLRDVFRELDDRESENKCVIVYDLFFLVLVAQVHMKTKKVSGGQEYLQFCRLWINIVNQ